MITLRKLASLPGDTRLRKIAWVCRELSGRLNRGESPDWIYIHGLGRLLTAQDLPSSLTGRGFFITQLSETSGGAVLARELDNLHFTIMDYMGVTPGDWDFQNLQGGLEKKKRTIRPFRVFLDDIRSPFNVGSIFRTGEALGIEKILLSYATPGPEHPRACRTAMGCDQVLPWERCSVADLEDEPSVFALELGGDSIDSFVFPREGTVILGSEELGLSPAAQDLVFRKNGRVSIPMLGAKGSINVSVAFGILMYAWNSARNSG